MHSRGRPSAVTLDRTEFTVSLVGGARPNFMKIKPVLDALEGVGLRVDLVHTGQHYDVSMSEVFFTDLGMRTPDAHLGVGSGTHAEQTARVMVEYEQLLAERPPDAVVVVGDINSTLACALVGAKRGALVAHVEAGLRSRDWSMPEEVNRVATDRLSDLLFAPSADAVANLEAEGYRPDQVHLVGNVMIDTLFQNLDRARSRRAPDRFGLEPGRYGLVTLHRPSNVDSASTLRGLIRAIAAISETLPLLFAVHPRTRLALKGMDLPPSLRLIEPQGYLDFLSLQADARIVLTDSGGLQEETTALGVPCLTLRSTTERPITISEGTNTLVGTDPADIIESARRVLGARPPAKCPSLWDGRASSRITKVLLDALRHPNRPRPTDPRA